MTADIGRKARMPNAALKPLEQLIGEWRTTGIHPAVPGTTLRGRASFTWLERGAFMVWRSQIDHPEFPDGIAIFASDVEAKSCFISYFDGRGVSRRYEVVVADDGFAMQRMDRKFSQRMVFKLEAGGNRIFSTGEMSREGKAWESDLSLTYERT
jgi:hypothetical protein